MTQQKVDSSTLGRLTDADALMRHQLNVAHYWQSLANGNGSAIAGTTRDTVCGELPSKWSLVGDISLHPWQLECQSKWFQTGKRGVVKVVTGAGKTILAFAVAQELQNKQDPDLRVAVVVPTIVLMQQWYSSLIEHSNLPRQAIGRLGGGYRDDFGGQRRVLIAVLASASTLLAGHAMAAELSGHLLLVVDECHRAGASKMSKVLDARRAYSLGLSATPERDDTPDPEDEDAAIVDTAEEENFEDSLIGQALGPIIYELTFAQAIERGILPKFEIRHYGLPFNAEERTAYDKYSREITELRQQLQDRSEAARRMGGGAMVGWARKIAARPKTKLAGIAAQYVQQIAKRKHLVYRARSRSHAVVQLLRQAFADNPDTRAILFHESVDEVMRMFSILRAEGFAVVPENYRLTDTLRAESIELFRRGTARVLVSARSLIEGFDVPAADVGIVVASSSSIRQRIQTLGRILRKHKSGQGTEKQAVLHVLYMAGSVDELVYEKTDWAGMIGAERNQYFLWDPESGEQPTGRPDPPRCPLPDEASIDWSQLQPGDIYPGRYEGNEYSCDSRGNIFDADERVVVNPQEIDAIVKKVKRSFGRFRVSPRRRAVLIRVTESEGWVTRFAGLLSEPFRIEPRREQSACVTDVTELGPGDPYEGNRDAGDEYRIKRRADGALVAKRVRRGELYARTTEDASDPDKGRDAERLVKSVFQAAARDGEWISRFRLNEHNHAFYLTGGKAKFLCVLDKGFEFPNPEEGE